MNVPLELTDTTFRTNLVTLSDAENYEDKVMVDYSSDEISTEEARELINMSMRNLAVTNTSFSADSVTGT